MTVVRLLRTAALALLLIAPRARAAAQSTANTAARPNIILILTDDVG